MAKYKGNKEYFIERLNKTYGEHYEYVSGYVDSESSLYVKCKHCGDTHTKSAQFIRRDKARCKGCKGVWGANKDIKCDCKECGGSFDSVKGMLYCSDECRVKSIKRKAGKVRRERLGLIKNVIKLDELIEKENNICYICGEECDKTDHYIDDKGYFVTGYKYPTRDHVIPLNKDGENTIDNIRLAHFHCNRTKRTNW